MAVSDRYLLSPSEPTRGAVSDQYLQRMMPAPPNRYWEAVKRGATPSGMVENLYRIYSAPLRVPFTGGTVPGRTVQELFEQPASSIGGNVAKALGKAVMPETLGGAAEMGLQGRLIGHVIPPLVKRAVARFPMLGRPLGTLWSRPVPQLTSVPTPDQSLQKASPQALASVATQAKMELAAYDAEPGGYRIFHEPRVGGAPEVQGVKSTAPEWYKDLAGPAPAGATRITRQHVDQALDKFAKGGPPQDDRELIIWDRLRSELGAMLPPARTAETLQAGATQVGAIKRALQATLVPPTVDESAALQARIMRPHLADLAQQTERAQRDLKKAIRLFYTIPPDPRYPNQPLRGLDFISYMEWGEQRISKKAAMADVPRPTLSPELQTLADELKRMMAERREMVRALGTGKLEHFIEDYFPHIWKDPKAAKDAFAQVYAHRPLAPSGFLKQRTIPTIEDGLERGLVPVSDNPIELVLLKLREMDRYLMGQRVFAEMKTQGLARFFRAGESQEGWAKIHDQIARVRHYDPVAKGFVERGQWMAPDGAARIVNNYLSPGLMGRSALYDGFRHVNNTMNQFNLGFSAFHAGFEFLDAQKSQLALVLQNLAAGRLGAVVRNLALTPIAPFRSLYQGNVLLKEYYHPGSTTPEVAQMVQWIKQGGGRFSEPWYYRNNSIENFWKALRGQHYGRATLQSFPALAEAVAKPIMQWMVPRMKAGVASDLMAFELSKLPPTASQDLQRMVVQRAWDSVDNRLGQLVYDNLFWNRTLKDILMISVRSVGWNWGTYREFLGAGADVATAAKALAQGRPAELTPRMAYAIASPALVAIYGAILTYLYLGHGPESLKDYFYIRTGRRRPDGSEDRISFPAYERDFAGYASHPIETMLHKTAPLPSQVVAMYKNEDFYGATIDPPSLYYRMLGLNDLSIVLQHMENYVKFAIQSFMPFYFQGYRKQRQFGAPAGEAAVLPFVGMMPAPASITRSDELNQALQLKHLLPGIRKKEQRQP